MPKYENIGLISNRSLNMKLIKKLIVVIAAIQIITLIPLTSIAAPVKVSGGLVEGTVEDGITVYKGIPFAAPL